MTPRPSERRKRTPPQPWPESPRALRVLVAGGAGMIGSHLCDYLLARGHEVICLDNLVTGRLANLTASLAHPRFCFVQHDVILELPPFPRLDHVYHLASPASPPGYTRVPIETLRVNGEGTRRLLELTHRHGARMLYSSTSQTYGDPLEHPQSEEYRGNVSCTGPRSMYDEAKRYGEALTVAYVRHHGVDARVVRIFNTYGPRSDPEDGRLVVNLITQALRRRPMTVYGNGTQTRSLCYVTDLVDGLVRAMDAPGTKGEVINLGSPEEHTVLEFAQMLREMTGSDSELLFTEPAVGDDPHVRCPEIRKARALLGWEPQIGVREGFLRTIDYFRAELGVTPVPAVPHPASDGNRPGEPDPGPSTPRSSAPAPAGRRPAPGRPSPP